jgi:hypothetical protein
MLLNAFVMLLNAFVMLLKLVIFCFETLGHHTRTSFPLQHLRRRSTLPSSASAAESLAANTADSSDDHPGEGEGMPMLRIENPDGPERASSSQGRRN